MNPDLEMPRAEEYREAARGVLRAAGWTPGRACGPAPAPDLVAEHGPPPRAAVAFLAEFGGLHLDFTNPRDATDDTDIDTASTPQFFGWVGSWSRAAGEPVFPVGELAHGNCVLLVGESGSLYGAFDAVLGRLGPDALTGLGRLVLDTSPLEPRLPFPPEALYRKAGPA